MRSAVLGVTDMLVHPRGTGVQWNPADHLCMAGQVLRRQVPGGTWTLSGEIHGRYTAGLPEVNRYMQQRASPARPPHQALVYLSLAICHELPQCPHCGSAPTLHPRQQRRLRTVPAASAKLRAAGPALGDAAVLAVPDIGHTHVCSMFARMSRYGPVAGGTTRQRVSRFAVQPGTSSHSPARAPLAQLAEQQTLNP